MNKIVPMKKVILILGFLFLGAAFAYWYFAVRLDYSKIVFVLPSSNRVSSPYFYKKDGDFFLADDLRHGFEQLGYKVSYRFREDYDDLKFGNAGNVLYFKGYYNFDHLPQFQQKDKRKRVLYLYYIEGLNPNILKEADVVAGASKTFVDEIKKSFGVKGVFVPQFTNPERFTPTKDDNTKAYSVLFVGSNHTHKGRKVVDYAIKAGVDLALFGKFWEDSPALPYLKGKYIDNDKLAPYYANANIVLNDHRKDMQHYGFISNRIFDVTAAGGFILTDYMPEIEQVYGDSIATYKDFDEFKSKLEFYLEHPEMRKQMAEKARQITLQNFTCLLAAKKIEQIFKNIKK